MIVLNVGCNLCNCELIFTDDGLYMIASKVASPDNTAWYIDIAAVQNSDFVSAITYTSENLATDYKFWVNETQLMEENAVESMGELSSPFPYTRLAAMTPTGSKAFYLYHQINSFIMAEDVWDSGSFAWTSSNITIPGM